MKAATRQGALALALGCAMLPLLAGWSLADVLAPAAPLSEPGLPAGLPALPSLGELMQREPHVGLALNGFDPVAYRLEGRPTAGSPDHELITDGMVWRFASAANLAAFRDAPGIYAPAFAGFDPTGVANGVAVDTDPSHFAVIGTRLFLFRSEENRRLFLQDRALLGAAEERWSAVRRTVAR